MAMTTSTPHPQQRHKEAHGATMAAVQSKGSSLAGLLSNVSVQGLVKLSENLTKLDIHSAKKSAQWLSKVVIQPAKFLADSRQNGEFSVQYAHTREDLSGVTTRGEFSEPIKKGLMFCFIPVYGYRAPAKSGAGIGVPELHTATHDAPSVFFCVVSSVHPFFSGAGIIRAAHEIMVGCVGASSEAPVSVCAGYANPVQLTTCEIGVSGGELISLHTEAATCWLLPLPQNRNLSGSSLLFAVICPLLLPKSITLPHHLSVKPAALWFAITSAFSLVASVWRWLMLKTYDLPVNPTERTRHLISLAELMQDVCISKKEPFDSRDEHLEALIALLDLFARDLHCLLEGNELPEGKA